MGIINRELVLGRLYKAEEATLNAIATEIVERAKAKAPVRKIFSEGGKRRRSRSASPETIVAAVRYIQNNKRLTEKQKWNALYIQRHPQEARQAVRRHGSVNKRRSTLIGTYRSVSLRQHGGLFKGQIIATEKVFRGRGITKGTTPLNRIERNVRPKRGFEPGPQFDERLDARGRYEVRSGRAFTNAEGQPIKPGDQPTQVRVGGRLKGSISEGEITRSGSRASIRISATAPYAIFVEFPTRHNAAQPFLLPALKEAKRMLLPTLANELRSQGLKG